MRLLVMIGLTSLVVVSCTSKKVEMKTGAWRGIISLQEQQLPFNFEVIKEGEKYSANLINGDEKILLDEVEVNGDSISMALHIFDAALVAKIEDGKLTGSFVKNYAKDASLPFSATFGESFRFSSDSVATQDYSGKYAVQFINAKNDTTLSVAIFHQKGNQVTGTFLTPTGDYRYLQGNVVEGKLMLSTFDGNHAFLFSATKSGETLTGDFYSGKTSHETWTGIKDEQAKLPDAASLTYLKPGFEKLEFSFPDLAKNRISPSDEKYKGKVLVLQIFGTWCPNCMDETKFLTNWYKANSSRGVEILGLAYERKDDFDYASGRVTKMKEKLGVPYDFVIAGTNDKEKASLTLPALNRIISFPTTIFIGKDGKVKHIHTGFSGPGTGIYYDQFIQYFNETVNELLAEELTSKK
jgi:thiol-disulfide isomerase/thioredoxin